MRFSKLLPWILVLGLLAYIGIKNNYVSHLPLPSMPAERTQPLVEGAKPEAGSGGEVLGPVSYARAVEVAAPAVVNIYTTQTIRPQANPMLEDPLFRRFFGGQAGPRERMQASLGSGVIVSSDGYILTNNHVVAGADSIVVALQDGRETKAKVIGTDPDSDLAVIKIDLGHLPALPFRTDPLRVGDVVLAIGDPFGVGQTVTQGIISALGRKGLGINTYEDFIQTDAAINPGNSGGALIDVYGNLVGINSAIYSRSGGNMGIGFAIPVTLAKDVMTAIIQNGKVTRGWLAVEVRSDSDEDVANLGTTTGRNVVVAGVLRGGPADQAGIRPGDKLQSIAGVKPESASQVVKQIASLKPGTDVKVVVERGGRQIDTQVRIGERPPQPQTQLPDDDTGQQDPQQ